MHRLGSHKGNCTHVAMTPRPSFGSMPAFPCPSGGASQADVSSRSPPLTATSFSLQGCKVCQGIMCLGVVQWVWIWDSQATPQPRCPPIPLSCVMAPPCIPTFLDTLTTQRWWCMEDHPTLECPCQHQAPQCFIPASRQWADKWWTFMLSRLREISVVCSDGRFQTLSFCNDYGVLGVNFGPRDVPILHRDPEKQENTNWSQLLGTC